MLIQKNSNPQRFNQFRPISLLGCLYKILTKMLVSMFRLALKTTISNNQLPFLPGRNILDGVVVINDVVDFEKKEKKECFFFKVDFEKVYDTINWKFLDYIMKRFGMCDKWRDWIKDCTFNGGLSIL